MKQTMQSLSNFFFSIKSKGANMKPGELNNATIAIILLKVATVLGREFQIDALKYISPLGRSSQCDKQVDESIKMLEMNDFIEIVDQNDNKKSCVCRFNKVLFLESLY